MKIMIVKRIEVGYSILAEADINPEDINDPQQLINIIKELIENGNNSQSTDHRDHSGDHDPSSSTDT